MNSKQVESTTMDEAQSQDIDAKLQSTNVADDLSEDQLMKISNQCKTGFEMDIKSRADWETDMKKWVALARQVVENKSYPWPEASNVKYPLLATAAMQFAARAYPALVPSNGEVVKSIVIGKDITGEKLEKANRVSEFMSYQVMHEMPRWDEEMDKMLMMLPVVGTMFKKTFYDKVEDKIVSKLVMPENLVVNYWTKSLDDCERISEIIQMSPRLVKERQLLGLFRDIDLGTPPMPTDVPMTTGQVQLDETTPYELIEQHTFLDIKDTGYAIPYIVTFERNTGKILRIQNRYHSDDVQMDDKNKKIVKVKPLQMYTKFGFVPNPDGSFYDIGFGVLLGPLNESVNTIINQLLDAGHLSTLQAGFIGKGLRMKMGDSRFRPGEWKPVNATGDDLRKQIVPLPTKDPSDTLFQLMGTLITSGKELASVAEIFTGKMPGQNTPATTTMATVEQGMKVFTAVYKRLFRALGVEFKKIFKLNATYLDPNQYIAVIDQTIGPDDFDYDQYDICPGADPTAVSQTEKLLKAQGLLEILPLVPGMLDPIEVFSRVLEAQEQPNWQKIFSKEIQASGQLPPPAPDPKLMAIQAKVEADQKKAAVDLQMKQQQMELDARSAEQKMQMEQQMHAQKMEQEAQKTQLKAASELAMANVFSATERAKGQQTLVNNQQAHQQKMQQTEESGKLQIQQQKAKAAASPSSKKSGSPTRKR